MTTSGPDRFALALQHHQAGRLEPAIALYQEILAATPGALPARANLAIALAQLGRHEAASVEFARALALSPNDPALRQNLVTTALGAGAALLDDGRPGEAAAAFRRAIEAAPDNAAAHGSLGSALAQLGDVVEAEAALRRALALAPHDARLHYHLGKVLHAAGRLADAIDACRAAVAADPALVDAWCELGSLLRLTSDPHGALTAFETAARAAPDHALTQLGLGGALHDLGRLDDAVAALRRAQALAPGDPEPVRSEALSLLLAGDLAQGWAVFERWRAMVPPDATGARAPDGPRWRGEPLAGRTILLHAEQGQGDTIQFARYAPLVAARGGSVMVRVPRSLVALLQSLDGSARVIGDHEPLPAYDLQAPLMSLPAVFGTTLDTVPATVPYLAADPARVARWAQILGGSDAPKIGIVWAGNPRHLRDAVRSLPVEHLAPLLAVERVRWFSLQVGAHAAGRAAGAMTDLASHLTDFAATAAAVAHLDLVISVDTSVAHLAGALGRPVWLLLPFAPDYRWLLGRADSPWYPTMRLFRQPTPGDWGAVIESVVAALVERYG